MTNKQQRHREEQTELSQKAVSLTPDILRVLEETREGAMEELDAVGDYGKKGKEYIPPHDHPTLIAIRKWKQYAEENNELKLLNNLNSMKIIATDELQLGDGTVVKLGYPDIEPDNIEIFGNFASNAEFKKIKSIHFKDILNSISFKIYKEKMENEGFRLPGNIYDIDGKTDERIDFENIFGQIADAGNNKYSTIIIDILGRAFSGFHDYDGKIYNESSQEYFISCSPSSRANLVRYLCLDRHRSTADYIANSSARSYGALFFKEANKRI